uniref:Uncharacterized protein n=1 Tax=Prymnesium polylepis TaxID=72548 RepID=A0A7S4MBF8_9EUKA
MPVPFPYYHVLKLMLLASLLAMSYAICQLMEESKGISFFIFAIVAAIMLGLEEISVAMADPFGDDDTDFDTDEMTRYCYEATVALLRDSNYEGETARWAFAKESELPEDVGDPVNQILPKRIRRNSTLGVLVEKVGEAALAVYDWGKFTMDAEARTYSNRLATNEVISTVEHVRRATLSASVHQFSQG